jgi:hypothetical protein
VRIPLASVLVWLATLGLAAAPGPPVTDAQRTLADAQKLERAGDSVAALEAYVWAVQASLPQ